MKLYTRGVLKAIVLIWIFYRVVNLKQNVSSFSHVRNYLLLLVLKSHQKTASNCWGEMWLMWKKLKKCEYFCMALWLISVLNRKQLHGGWMSQRTRFCLVCWAAASVEEDCGDLFNEVIGHNNNWEIDCSCCNYKKYGTINFYYKSDTVRCKSSGVIHLCLKWFWCIFFELMN